MGSNTVLCRHGEKRGGLFTIAIVSLFCRSTKRHLCLTFNLLAFLPSRECRVGSRFCPSTGTMPVQRERCPCRYLHFFVRCSCQYHSQLDSRLTHCAIESIRDLWQLPPHMMCEAGDFVFKLGRFHGLPCRSTLTRRTTAFVDLKFKPDVKLVLKGKPFGCVNVIFTIKR